MPRTKLNADQRLDVCIAYQAGDSAVAIARRFEVSENSIYRVLRRSDVTIRSASEAGLNAQRGRLFTDEDRQAMVAAVEAGESVSSIASRLDVHPSTVYGHTRHVQRATLLAPIVVPPEPDNPRTWQDRAACREVPDPEIFFVEKDDTAGRRNAVRWCEACPVRAACLREAAGRESYGIWGGIWFGHHTSARLRKAAAEAAA